jgi:hypothetical protein
MKPVYRPLIQQGLDMRSVVDVFVGQIKCDDLAAAGVNANMQFAPRAPLRGSMLFKQPFARATQLQPGAVDDQVQVARFNSRPLVNRQSARPPTERRMVGNGQINRQHLHDRGDQSLALTESQPKNRPQNQSGFNGEIGIDDSAAERLVGLCSPTSQGFFREPDG